MVEASKPLCPRCQLPLAAQRSRAISALGCGGCGGVWVDNDNARRALADATVDAVQLSQSAGRAARRSVSTGSSGLRCPACERAMTRLRLSPSNVEVDLCHDHGTWFDRDELAAALRPDPSPASGPATAAAPIAAPPGYASAEPEVVPDFRAGTDAAILRVVSIAGSVLLGVLAITVSIATGGDDDD